MGLANRVVAKGDARRAAEALAAEIARFPQSTMRGDRASAYVSMTMPLEEALANEFRIGLASLSTDEAADGAMSFAKGKGRHGTFE
jgi:enoyl-CoA hydratase